MNEDKSTPRYKGVRITQRTADVIEKLATDMTLERNNNVSYMAVVAEAVIFFRDHRPKPF